MRYAARNAASAAVSTALVLALLILPGCPPPQSGACGCPQTDYDPVIVPADFVAAIDNPYLPLVPGTVMIYEADTDEGLERVRIEVTDHVKIVLGVTCTVVHDTVTLNGEITEDTYDWYAQDKLGNVWYFGEVSHEYEDGIPVSAFGSWEGGVDCAKPGIAMPAVPKVGQTYRQEFYACIAEDMGTILSLSESVTVPAGTFANCLRTKDFTPLDATVLENKLYAPGVGFIMSFDEDGEPKEGLVEIATK